MFSVGLSLLLLLSPLALSNRTSVIKFSPSYFTLVIGESSSVTLHADPPLSDAVSLEIKHTPDFSVSPSPLILLPSASSDLSVSALVVVAEAFLEIASCRLQNESKANCSIDFQSSYGRLRVIRSAGLDVVVIVVGWLYFLAWSVSFWPQIILNFQRKSVTGLNLDFVLLNTIGFAAYALYNSLIFFDDTVQREYKLEHPRGPIPVLLNDVVFAAHALFACILTGLQAFFLEREQQQISRACRWFGGTLICLAFLAGLLAALSVLSILRFTDILSYIKMAVTLSKYIPQALFNYRRKSTIGWSIWNVLLDLTGGTLDLLQIVLQAVNVANWSAFIGNPVKFGLGFVSIFFDIIFIVQHYVLYKDVDVVHANYVGMENQIVRRGSDETLSVEPPVADDSALTT